MLRMLWVGAVAVLPAFAAHPAGAAGDAARGKALYDSRCVACQKMGYAVADAADRADLIAYLRSLSAR